MSKELEQLVPTMLRSADVPMKAWALYECRPIQRAAAHMVRHNPYSALSSQLQKMRKAGLIRYTGNGWVIA